MLINYEAPLDSALPKNEPVCRKTLIDETMKVLLLQAYMGEGESAVFPVGLALLASSVWQHQVKVFDPNISPNPYGELKTILLDFEPAVVGISLRNIDSTNKRTVKFYYAFLGELLDIIKSVSKAKIIIGGSGFSIFASDIMEYEQRIDYGVFLEGEQVLPALIENLDSPERVPSIYYRKNGKVLFTGSAPPCDLNLLNTADWAILPMLSYTVRRDAIGVETKRGCALGCVYCVYGFLNGKRYRLKKPELVVNEIEYLTQHCGVQRFMFLDSVFNIPMAHAEAVCHEILRRGLRVNWSAWFSEAAITDDFLQLVAQAGCDTVLLSPDALADPVLKTLGKNLTFKQVIETYRRLRTSSCFDVSYNFFKNPPGQTFYNFLSIAFFCLKAKFQMGRKVHFEFNSLRIEPHSQLYQIALREGVISEGVSLLLPRYYTNRKTWLIGAFFDLLLKARRK